MTMKIFHGGLQLDVNHGTHNFPKSFTVQIMQSFKDTEYVRNDN